MTKTNKITRFGLIRHAQTEWNRAKRIQGQSDSPLTAKGKKQAEKWGDAINEITWDSILASDIGRAFETATIINHILQVPLTSDKRLREQNWGSWTGKTVGGIEKDDPELLAGQTRAGWQFCPPDGEDRFNVWKRSQTALIEAAASWPGKTILVVTHEGVIKSLIYRLSGRRFLAHEPPLLKSFHLHWLVHDRDGLRLEKVNAIALG